MAKIRCECNKLREVNDTFIIFVHNVAWVDPHHNKVNCISTILLDTWRIGVDFCNTLGNKERIPCGQTIVKDKVTWLLVLYP